MKDKGNGLLETVITINHNMKIAKKVRIQVIAGIGIRIRIVISDAFNELVGVISYFKNNVI